MDSRFVLYDHKPNLASKKLFTHANLTLYAALLTAIKLFDDIINLFIQNNTLYLHWFSALNYESASYLLIYIWFFHWIWSDDLVYFGRLMHTHNSLIILEHVQVKVDAMLWSSVFKILPLVVFWFDLVLRSMYPLIHDILKVH